MDGRGSTRNISSHTVPVEVALPTHSIEAGVISADSDDIKMRVVEQVSSTCALTESPYKRTDFPEMSSPDATSLMANYGKRKRIRNTLTGKIEEKENAPPVEWPSPHIDCSPPPPILENMSFEPHDTAFARSPMMPSTSGLLPHETCNKSVCSLPRTTTANNAVCMFDMYDADPTANRSAESGVHFLSTELARFRSEVLKEFRKIQKQTSALRQEITALRYAIEARNNLTERQMPVTFPMRSMNQWNLLNSKLSEDEDMKRQLVDYLSKSGGSSYGQCTRVALRTIIADDITPYINWRGTNNKVPISCSPVSCAVVEAVMQHKFPGVTRLDVKEKIQQWIQKARRRVIKEEVENH